MSGSRKITSHDALIFLRITPTPALPRLREREIGIIFHESGHRRSFSRITIRLLEQQQKECRRTSGKRYSWSDLDRMLVLLPISSFPDTIIPAIKYTSILFQRFFDCAQNKREILPFVLSLVYPEPAEGKHERQLWAVFN